MHRTICVFCASSSQVDNRYFRAAQEVADVCCNHQIHVLFGGGKSGLMGALANRVLQRKGKITGIIPSFMKEQHWDHEEVEEMVVVEDMRERKRRLIENVDAVLALPGGIGTLEELVEVITLKQLGRFNKPIVILNTEGYYNPLFHFFDEMIERNFMHELNKNIWQIIDTAEDLIDAIENNHCWDPGIINKGQM